MKLGIYIFATDYTIRIDELAREAEARGFESLFVPEHTHIPAERRSPWPGGGDLPKEYWHTLDPFVSLMAAAAATKTLRIGTGICLLIERDPIVTAKEAASLDLLSDGRFELAIGAGWNAEEMENHGTAFPTRFRVMSERARAIKVLWTEEEPEFHGEFVNFDPVWSYPKPVQRPNPPILVGGETDHTLRRVVDWADGWFPRGRHGFDPVEGMERLRRIAGEAGRSMDTLSASLFGGPPRKETIDRAAEAGMNRVLLPLPSNDRDDVLRRLDAHTELLRSL